MASSIGLNLQSLKNSIAKAVEDVAEGTVIGAVSDVRKDQTQNNAFWKNRTYTAREAIGGKVEQEGNIFRMSAGFEEGEPAEERSSGRREYGQYLAEYTGGVGSNGVHFLGACLNALASRFRDNMENVIDYDLKETKATFSEGEWK